jgi:hypothetical protein
LQGLDDSSPLLQGNGGAVIQGDFYHYRLNKKGISGLSRSFPDAVKSNYVTYQSNSKGLQSKSLLPGPNLCMTHYRGLVLINTYDCQEIFMAGVYR